MSHAEGPPDIYAHLSFSSPPAICDLMSTFAYNRSAAPEALVKAKEDTPLLFNLFVGLCPCCESTKRFIPIVVPPAVEYISYAYTFESFLEKVLERPRLVCRPDVLARMRAEITMVQGWFAEWGGEECPCQAFWEEVENWT
jgi:hypothetical protein